MRCCTTMVASSTSGCWTARLVRGGSWTAAAAACASDGCAAAAHLHWSCCCRHRVALCADLLSSRLSSSCPAGLADPSEGLPYPLVVQDKELRTLLEIKPAAEAGPGQPGGELRAAAAQAAAAAAAAVAGDEGPAIIVPTVRTLPAGEQPDLLVREQEPPVVQRMQDAEGPDVAGTSAAARAASDAWRSAKRAVALDPPYIRYVQVRGRRGEWEGRVGQPQAGRHCGRPGGRAAVRSGPTPTHRLATYIERLPRLVAAAHPRRPGPGCGVRPR